LLAVVTLIAAKCLLIKFCFKLTSTSQVEKDHRTARAQQPITCLASKSNLRFSICCPTSVRLFIPRRRAANPLKPLAISLLTLAHTSTSAPRLTRRSSTATECHATRHIRLFVLLSLLSILLHASRCPLFSCRFEMSSHERTTNKLILASSRFLIVLPCFCLELRMDAQSHHSLRARDARLVVWNDTAMGFSFRMLITSANLETDVFNVLSLRASDESRLLILMAALCIKQTRVPFLTRAMWPIASVSDSESRTS